MIALKNVIYLAGVSLAVLARQIPVAHAQTHPADLPSDVTELVGRRSSCLELYKKAFDPEHQTRPQEMMASMRSLRCDEIENDEKALRQKYAGNPEIIEALKATWVKVIQRLPVRGAVPPPDLDQPR
jgi:hypothetical protein